MPNKLIKDLIDKGAVTLKEQGYSIRSREYTLLTWKQFQEFCNKKGYETYLPSHKDEFITELGKCTPPLRQSTIDRKAGSMKMLDLLATKGTWGKGMLNPLQELLPEFNSFLDAQEEYLIKTGYSECFRILGSGAFAGGTGFSLIGETISLTEHSVAGGVVSVATALAFS